LEKENRRIGRVLTGKVGLTVREKKEVHWPDFLGKPTWKRTGHRQKKKPSGGKTDARVGTRKDEVREKKECTGFNQKLEDE